MSWQAANIRSKRQTEATDTQQHRETVEAALNRLAKAYSAAMNCVGAWGRADTEDMALKLGQAARRTFEQALLLDPSNEHATLWRRQTREKSLPGPGVVLRSEGHRSTVEQLAYLSLVNYADLLLAGCPQTTRQASSQNLLDRGLVKARPQLQERTCWRTVICNEAQSTEQDSARELGSEDENDKASAMDVSSAKGGGKTASERDQTDASKQPESTMDVSPAREVNETNTPMDIDKRAVADKLDTQDDNSNLAIEPTKPPAEKLTDEPSAWATPRETTVEEESEETTVRLALAAYLDATSVDPTDPILWLKLACAARRLGRLLRPSDHPAPLLPYRRLEKEALERAIENRLAKRAWEEWQAEETMDYQYPATLCAGEEEDDAVLLPIPRPSWTTLGRLLLRCTADRIQLQLSPLLALPQNTLGKICQFLEAPQIARFEATCRALSAMIVTARAALDHQQERRGSMEAAIGSSTRSLQAVSKKVQTIPIRESSNASDAGASEDTSHRASRASKRLRSQIITSGKRAERQSRRTSTDFCLLATTLGCRADNAEYQRIVAAAKRVASNAASAVRVTNTKTLPKTNSSLWTFVESQPSADPTAILFSFLVHVSRHVREVFGSDPSGSTLLTSTLLDCFDLLSRRRGLEDGMTDRWWDSPSRPASRKDLFSMDLLHAELCLLRCEREDVVDMKSVWVASMAPRLQSLLGDEAAAGWDALKTRCHWLNATFYLWRGRLTHNVSESRQAELRGLGAIRDAIASLHHRRIATPHLVSPSRKGPHWKELAPLSLETFCQEIQASSVLLQAQEKFLNVVAQMEAGTELSTAHSEALASIGRTLQQRYGDESPVAKYSELVRDFLAEHGEKVLLSSFSEEGEGDGLYSWFDRVAPTVQIRGGDDLAGLERPCILTIMLYCVQTEPNQDQAVLKLVIRLCSSILELVEDVRSQLLESKAAEVSFCNEDDDSSSSDEDELFVDSGVDSGNAERGVQRSRIRQYSVFLRLLLIKVSSLLERGSTEPGHHKDDLIVLLHRSLRFLSSWFDSVYSRASRERDLVEDLRVFGAVQRVFRVLQDNAAGVQDRRVLQGFVSGLIVILQKQRQVLESLIGANCSRQGRSVRSRIIKRRADFVAAVCCNLGLLLSECPVQVVGGRMLRSYIFETGNSSTVSTISILCESLLWLWRSVKSKETTNTTIRGSLFDRLSVERLRVPVASVIVSLCGSACSTDRAFASSPTTEDKLELTDFYDSDTSTIDWLADRADGNGNVDDCGHSHLLRVIGQIVHCISEVFKVIEEKEAVQYDYYGGYHTSLGPSFPLIVARVLNRLADRLLLDFAETSKKSPLWSDYPYGTRSTGRVLDSILFKAYRCLHGFTLVHAGENKESSTGTALFDPRRQKNKPESAAAAAMLYRCIMRAYSHGRKSPAKLALETVLSALPPSETTSQGHDIRKYLFEDGGNYSGLRDLCSFVTKGTDWEANFADVQHWVEGIDVDDNLEPKNEVMMVRRGLSRLIAQGSIPQYVDSGDEDDQRPAASRAEEKLSRKFFAILDCLCLGNADDYEAWYKAAQCLTSKADLVADRLGLSKGFARSASFAPSHGTDYSEQIRRVGVRIEQDPQEEVQMLDEGWIQCLGSDLSVYVTFSWSSLQSLRSCSRKVSSEYQDLVKDKKADADTGRAAELRAWHEIEHLGKQDDLGDWQQAWGGLFVSALRKLAFRCVRLALFILYKRQTPEGDVDVLISEVTESLGVNLYTELVGSQLYGYPMKPMNRHLKREVACASMLCFQKAVDVVTFAKDDPMRPTWDLKLMIGKCHEKIAKSHWKESFVSIDVGKNESGKRCFEVHMAEALGNYHSSMSEAKALEKANELVVERSGGSSHGSCEVVYRLHASRLKCLIKAMNRSQEERELAELEALRLTECYWFTERPKNEGVGVRDRVWNVLVDVVAALVQCRLDFPFFHRSVYRHAQALMWAPILSDPVGARSQGSLGTVPATRACMLRGLNYATNAASSAVVVMGSLFEKRRPQLCAVWVTSDSSNSALQAINNSVRKYDSLRGKYISAYVESLRLCRRRNEMESFLKWAYSAKRDLPSYFAVSAEEPRSGVKSHSRDTLLVKPREFSSFHFLTSVKRQANSALAAVIYLEVEEKTNPKDGKVLEHLLKLSYACYLRLNCDSKDVMKCNSWYHHRSSGMKDIVKALTTAYQRSTKEQPLSGRPNDWSCDTQAGSLLEAALKKCKELFPTLSGSFYSKKAGKTKEKNESKGIKRKEPPAGGDSCRRSYEVTIPEGLSEGDTFLTSISDGDKIKKVKLTVPSGASKTLRFSL